MSNLVDISDGWKEIKTNEYTENTHIFDIENLSHSEKLIHAINLHFLVSMTDKSGKITSVNQNYIQATGYSEAELIGANHSIESYLSIDYILK